MASVVQRSQLQATRANLHFSDMESLPLSLDLSLGGLFSMQLNSDRGSLTPDRSPVVESTASDGCFPLQYDPPLPRMVNVDGQIYSPDASASLEARSGVCESGHNGRKRRKGFLDCNPHKKAKPEELHPTELASRPACSLFLEVPTPGLGGGTSDDSCSPSYPQGTLAARGSSGQLSSWRTRDYSGNFSDKAECTVRNRNGSSSNIAYDCIRNEKESLYSSQKLPRGGCFKGDQAEQERSGVATSCAYPSPVIPRVHPCGVPASWSFPYPWFAQGVSSRPLSYPSAVNEQLVEAFATPFGDSVPDASCSISVQPGSSVCTWLSKVPAGVDVLPQIFASGIPSDKKADNFVACGNNSQEVLARGQDDEVEGNCLRDLDARAVSMDGQQNVNAISFMKTKIMHLHVHDSSIDKPVTENLGALCSDDGDCPPLQLKANMQPEKINNLLGDASKAGSRFCKQSSTSPRECQAAAQSLSPAERQKSLPLEGKKMPKKKKVVRFNSLTVAETRFSSEDISSERGDEKMTASQQCMIKLSSRKQPYSQGASKGPCGEGDEVPKSILRNNTRAYRETDDARHSASKIVDAEIEQEKCAENCSGTFLPLKSALKNKHRSRQSLASLPRVITRGLGPQGKTIHGVMYITPAKQARLICVCHGMHMSPVEFVQHSGSSDLSNPERSILLESVFYSESDVLVPLVT